MRLPLSQTTPQIQKAGANHGAYEDFFSSAASTPANSVPSSPTKDGNAARLAWFIAGVALVLLCLYSCS